MDGHGNILVTDSGGDMVENSTSAGVFNEKFGSSGSGNGQFNSPHGITISSGNIYVAD